VQDRKVRPAIPTFFHCATQPTATKCNAQFYVKTFSDPINYFFVLDRLPVTDTQHSDDQVPAVYNRKPKWKHTANPNIHPNPNPNTNTYFLVQSR